jgi:hypothetical protein
MRAAGAAGGQPDILLLAPAAGGFDAEILGNRLSAQVLPALQFQRNSLLCLTAPECRNAERSPVARCNRRVIF